MNHLPAKRGDGPKTKANEGQEKLREGINDTKEFKDRIAVLTIAYHNLAVEQEFLYMVSYKTGATEEAPRRPNLNLLHFFSTKKLYQATKWLRTSP